MIDVRLQRQLIIDNNSQPSVRVDYEVRHSTPGLRRRDQTGASVRQCPARPYSSIIGILLVEPYVDIGDIRQRCAFSRQLNAFALLINLWTDDAITLISSNARDMLQDKDTGAGEIALANKQNSALTTTYIGLAQLHSGLFMVALLAK